MPMIEATGSNFKELTSKGVVIADIYGDNCYFCELLDEVLKPLSFELPMLTIVRGNGTQYPEIDLENLVYGHPTMIFFKDGVEMERQSGFRSAEQIREILAKYMY